MCSFSICILGIFHIGINVFWTLKGVGMGLTGFHLRNRAGAARLSYSGGIPCGSRSLTGCGVEHY